MSTIGIDVNPALRAEKTGTEEYTVSLLNAMQALPLQANEEVFLYSKDPWIKPLPPGWQSRPLAWNLSRFWTVGRLTWEMFRRPPNVLFVPAHVLPHWLPKKTVTTIHDVCFRRFPGLYQSRKRHYLESTTKFALKHATIILTPSEFTKNELLQLYKADPAKIVVTPLAPNHERFKPSGLPPSHTFVTVSRLEDKKNIKTLIRAFELFKGRRGVGDPFELILAGKPGFGFEGIRTLIERSSARSSIKMLGFVSDEQVVALMQSAYAYVYPSWYEGLGISALEAMAAGTALIASDIPALHEAAGDAALYADPREPQAFAQHMSRLADEPTLREDLIQKGIERVKDFTWTKTAELTWQVLRS